MLKGVFITLVLLSIQQRFLPVPIPDCPFHEHEPHRQISHSNLWPSNPSSLEAVFSAHRRHVSKALNKCTEYPCTALLAILLSGDVQLNPGPNATVYPCGICQESVTWSCRGICCDSCDVWFHHTCVDVGSAEYEALSRPTVAWICPRCDSINCSSFTFRSYEVECSNYYDPLQHSHIESVASSGSFSPPRTSSPKISSSSSFTSTPNSGTSNRKNKTKTSTSSVFELPKKFNLRIMNVNCQCLSSKKQELAAAIQYTKPDIVCGTESWLRGIKPGKNPTHDAIKSSEMFPPQYEVYRNDRNIFGGGVFILVHKSITSSEEPQFVTDCEVEWVKVKMKNQKDLHIGAFYTPDRNPNDFQELNRSLGN